MDDLQQRTARAIINVFETGRILGNYGAIAVMKGDTGHLSYGRSQSTLGSGTLAALLGRYCDEPDARYAKEIGAFLPAVQKKDFSLDTNDVFRSLLKKAGDDPAMQATQDKFFDDNYLAPACTVAQAMGITDPLGQTVVYDSHVQGGWSLLKSRMPPVAALGAQAWVGKYIDVRTAWLKACKDPLPSTAYRMDSFKQMIADGKWDLALPLKAHGLTITAAALQANAPPIAGSRRTLVLVEPYLRGDDVREVQAALAAKGNLPVGTPDGVYGPFTSKLVATWQSQQGVTENGVGPLTRASLGLPA